MKTLAIDTSALVATAAICEDETPKAIYSLKTGLTHSRTMLPLIKHLLEDTETAIDDIDLFAVSSGPGSFTGVRIGVSCIKGLAFGKHKPCVGVSTLEAMALSLAPLGTDTLLCPVMDARRGQVYHAIFESHGGTARRLTPDGLGNAEALVAEVEAMHRPVLYFGDGAPIVASLDPPAALPVPAHCHWQNAYGVALAALRRYREAPDPSVFTDELLRPSYLRPSQAEREADEKENATSILS